MKAEVKFLNYCGKCFDDKRQYAFFINLTNISSSRVGELYQYLSPEELEYINTIKSKKRLESFIYGRLSLKIAGSLFCMERKLKDISVSNGILGQPVITVKGRSNISGSISHCDNCAASIVFDEELVFGIDIEDKNRDISNILIHFADQSEIEAVKKLDCPETLGCLILWTAKESLSKCLKTGFTIPLEIFRIRTIEKKKDCYKVLYANFNQFETSVYVMERNICSLTYPKKLSVSLNMDANKTNL